MIDEALHKYGKIARATSILSIACIIFTITTFAAFPYFRKPINRLIIYASFGNMLCNVATIINISAIPGHGGTVGLCRFQGFFMQTFTPADSMWTLSMALNVYLTFFRKYDARSLRSLEMKYVVINYGIFLLPGFVYLMLDLSPLNPRIYGNAGLWCWCTQRYEWLRFTFFYIPVWVAILLTIAIYLRTGREIFRQRAFLRNSNRSCRNSSDPPIPLLRTGNPFTANIHNGIQRVTEIEVVCEDVNRRDNDRMDVEQCKSDRSSQFQARNSFSSTRQLSTPPPVHAPQQENPHCVSTGQKNTCTSCCNSAIWPYSNNKQTDRDLNRYYATASITTGTTPAEALDTRFADLDRIESSGSSSEQQQYQHQQDPEKLHTPYGVANDAAWGYAKVAFLCFVALFIVWVSTGDRQPRMAGLPRR
ncbi:hypothetical protein MPH_12882 [Macrophomina phaseolina MS6]|uniref:G-protein coupled receptors family 2 profile 2 domain-containing protein n=1 Tax=Macrophomina phaseolina (strain MS6) TaxID=1126212 RepID=K2R6Y3_MACPH|nr:hypothetical protein MPH_12882 [Macrophomina phaseolina MS6]